MSFARRFNANTLWPEILRIYSTVLYQLFQFSWHTWRTWISRCTSFLDMSMNPFYYISTFTIRNSYLLMFFQTTTSFRFYRNYFRRTWQRKMPIHSLEFYVHELVYFQILWSAAFLDTRRRFFDGTYHHGMCLHCGPPWCKLTRYFNFIKSTICYTTWKFLYSWQVSK